jgi:uncharacterized membrane protein
MVRAFDVFASLAVLILLTGGFVHRFGKVYLDLASVDTAAILSLVLLAFIPAGRIRESKIMLGLERLFASPQAELQARWFFGLCFAILFVAHVAKHWSLVTDGYDLSFVHQALFFPLRGPFLPADISQSGTALGEHLLFSLVPLTLLTSWIRADELVFLIQAVSIAIPLGMILFRGPLRDRRGIALWIALILLMSNRSLRNALMFDFREDSFGLLGFTIALLALHAGRVGLYFFGLLLALLSKESMPMIAPFLAFPILWSKSLGFSSRTRKILAGVTIILSLGYLIVAFKVLMPYFNPNAGTASPLATRFKEFGASPTEILANVLTRPDNWLKLLSHIFDKYAFLYLLMLLGPRFMTFLSREALLWLLPGLALFGLNILSGFRNQTAMIFHYDLAGIPFLAWGTLIGLRDHTLPLLDKLTEEVRLKRSALLILFSLSFSEKWPLFHLTFQLPSVQQIHAHVALLRLDPEVSVLTGSRLSAQVNAHRKIRVRDESCTPAREQELRQFEGYRIMSMKTHATSDCPAPNFPPLFQNSEISIYRYSLENSPR